MEHQRQHRHSADVGCRDPDGDHLPGYQVGTAHQQRQCRNLTDGAETVAQEHIHQVFLRQGGHHHMVQGRCSGDAIQTCIPGDGGRPQQHHKCPGTQGRIKGILAQATPKELHNNDGKAAAHRRDPIGRGGRKGQCKEQPRDQCRAVRQGIPLPGCQRIESLRRHSSRQGYEYDTQRPDTQYDHARSQCRHQSDHHIQHQTAGPEITANMRRRSDSQFHFFSSFAFLSAIADRTSALPVRKLSTRGSLPGQVKAQQPHSMQSKMCSRSSSDSFPHLL